MNEYEVSRIPGKRPDRTPADVRINGPHEVFKERSFTCEGDCGTEMVHGENKFYFFGTGDFGSKNKRLCADCARERII